MKAEKVTLTLESEDASTTLTYIVPACVARFLSFNLIDWEERWEFTPKEYNEYLKNQEALTSKNK